MTINSSTGSSSRSTSTGPGAPSRVRWIILAFLVGASFVAYLLRSNMSIAGEAMMGDLGFDKVELGMVLAAFAWGYGLFQFPGGLLGDRFGSRRTLALLALMWGVLTLLVGLLPVTLTPAMILGLLAGLRFLMGIAQAPFFPVTSGGTVSHWFPVSGWALPNGLMSAGLTLGAAATAPVVAWLTQEFGWRFSFLLLAPTGFLLSLSWWWYARDEPSQHRSVSSAELDLITRGRAAKEEEPFSWLEILRNRQLLLLTFSYFCMNYVFYIFFNWFFVYLVEVRGFSVLQGGFVAALPWLVGAAFAAFGGWWCDRLSQRLGPRWGCRIPALTGLSLAAVLLVLGAVAQSSAIAVILLSLCFACTQLTDPAYWSAAIAIADRQASAATGMLNTGGNVVGGFGALLVPLVAEAAGWVPALATGSVFAILGALAWLKIRADQPLIANTRELQL
ncbi:MAG: MFS transporter [bacterium]|nr:MFS transporter [bacterium]